MLRHRRKLTHTSTCTHRLSYTKTHRKADTEKTHTCRLLNKVSGGTAQVREGARARRHTGEQSQRSVMAMRESREIALSTSKKSRSGEASGERALLENDTEIYGNSLHSSGASGGGGGKGARTKARPCRQTGRQVAAARVARRRRRCCAARCRPRDQSGHAQPATRDRTSTRGASNACTVISTGN
eukprot:3071594-Pleurochrysis_carterae.AAC.2